jgi:imidazole glycerol-phosphate synthase subunit HisF
MLRTRLVTVLTFNEGVLYRTKLFEPDYRYTTNFIDTWSVDEIIALDVTRPEGGSPSNSTLFLEALRRLASRCFVPIAAGGGIRTMDDVKRIMASGADKVVVNSGAIERPKLITEIAESYGAQCVVLSIDATKAGSGYEVKSTFGRKTTGLTPAAWAREGSTLGAGEVFLTSIDNDGSLNGYDLDLCRGVVDNVGVPVLISGGAGSWQHFVDGVKRGGASAVCTSNIYHFTETSLKSAKLFMARAGIPVRV